MSVNYRRLDAIGLFLHSFGGGMIFASLCLLVAIPGFWHRWTSVVIFLIGVLLVITGCDLRRRAKADHRLNHSDEVF